METQALLEAVKAVAPAAKKWNSRVYLGFGFGDSFADGTGLHLFGIRGGGNVADRAACKQKAAELRAAGLNLPTYFRAKSGTEESI